MCHIMPRGSALVALLITPLFAAPIFADVTFTDVTPAGMALTDDLTESLAWGDYDDDGDPDLYLTVDGTNRLYRNDGGGSFADVTTAAGVGNALWGVGTSFGDLDNDGDLDLYTVNFGAGTDVLYRNDGPVGPGGQHVFTDVTLSAGTTIGRSSRGMTFVDYNRDGLLDIYVNAIGDDILYENQGNLQFQDVAQSVGITDVGGQGVGVTATDVNNDGWIDLFTGNRSNDPNYLFINNGGTFTQVGGAAGITETGLGMGVAALDYDNDLDMDLYWTTWPEEENAFYRNDTVSAATFVDVAASTSTLDPSGWGISINTADIDNDGWMDFYVTNGFSDTSSANVLFHNDGQGAFSDATGTMDGGGLFDGRGVGFADFDNDGDQDIIVTADAGQPNRLWRNDSDNVNHWLGLSLNGVDSNVSGIGARIEVATGDARYVQELISAAGRGSANDLRVLFGLADDDSINAIVIRWSNGNFQVINDADVDEFLKITENVGPDADFDDDGDMDADDIDALAAIVANNINDSDFDLTGDGEVDLEDRDQWLNDAGALNLFTGNSFLPGDANLDGVVDGFDFLAWNQNKFTAIKGWTNGDLNFDGMVDGLDFMIWNAFKFQSADGVSAVPEPGTAGIAVLCLFFVGCRRSSWSRSG